MGYFVDYYQKLVSEAEAMNASGAKGTVWLNQQLQLYTPKFNLNSSFLISCKFRYKPQNLIVYISKSYEYSTSLSVADGLTVAPHPGAYYDAYIKGKKTGGKGDAPKTSEAAEGKPKTTGYDKEKIAAKDKKLIEDLKYKPYFAPPTKVLQQNKENTSDSAMKSAIGTMWGVAEIGLFAAAPALSLPTNLLLAGGNILMSSILSSQGISKPISVDLALDLAVGYSIYAGVKGVVGRGAQYAASFKTPYFSLAYKEGMLNAKVTAPQVAQGIVTGGQAWKNTLVGIGERNALKEYLTSDVASELYSRNLNGDYIFNSVDDVSKAFANKVNEATMYSIFSRNPGNWEKGLDMVLQHSQIIPAIVSGGYIMASSLQDIHDYQTSKEGSSSIGTRSSTPAARFTTTALSMTSCISSPSSGPITGRMSGRGGVK